MEEAQSSKQKVLYEELTPPEFRQRMTDVPVAYLPLGTLEFHGEHMPLGSDGIQPFEFFKEVAAEIGGIVLPALFLGPDKMEVNDGLEFYGKDRGNVRMPQSNNIKNKSSQEVSTGYLIHCLFP
jgi:hypothetical protein